jgi:leader peptidase (prepilin peptidase)/N-methyltransferase
VPGLALVGTVLAGPFWAQQPLLLRLTYVLALVWGCTLAVIDLEVSRLPDRLVLPAYPVGGVLLGVCAVVSGDGFALLRVVACSGAAVVVYLTIAVVGSRVEGLGLGDVKLAGVLGGLLAWFGWYPAVLGLAAGFAVGGVVTAVLLVARRVDRRSSLPFGPSMVFGAYLCGLVAPLL